MNQWTYPAETAPRGPHVWTYPETEEFPAGGLSLTAWGDVVVYRGEGLYSREDDGIWMLCGRFFGHGALWIGAADLRP